MLEKQPTLVYPSSNPNGNNAMNPFIQRALEERFLPRHEGRIVS
jgi:hypothetical protein